MKTIERKLASVRVISNIQPIPNADKLVRLIPFYQFVKNLNSYENPRTRKWVMLKVLD